ncbi:GM26509 [Drosophila sechellia]|uniref:GM26509 n=1 Tax=Drosophila sechellia TaxID=7238 RepID=B4HFF7_DROSE|nr:GM26509 [Drosophila sechellia]
MLSNISLSSAPELVDLYGLVLKFLVSSETTLFYFNPTGQKCSWETLPRTILSNHPQIIWFREETYPGLYKRHSSNLFVMTCLSSTSYGGQLQLLAESLTRYRSIFGVSSEFYFLDGGFRAKYASVFHLTENSNELYDKRNYFNTSWAYTITSVKWNVIEAQQRHFGHPVFRYSTDLCFSSETPWGLLIAPESFYREPLQHFNLKINQAGLITHWMTQSFYEMVRAGRMTIKDYSRTNLMKPLRIQDLRKCWLIFAVGLGTSTVVFTIELLLIYTNVFLNSL